MLQAGNNGLMERRLCGSLAFCHYDTETQKLDILRF